MKKLLFAFCMIFFAASFSNLNAQTQTCTPAQVEACKKVCGTSTSCTPAQKAACQKVCNNNTSTKVALTDVTKSSLLKSIANPTSCSSSKLTKNNKKSCTAKNEKIVKTEIKSTTPIAQTVASKTKSSEE